MKDHFKQYANGVLIQTSTERRTSVEELNEKLAALESDGDFDNDPAPPLTPSEGGDGDPTDEGHEGTGEVVDDETVPPVTDDEHDSTVIPPVTSEDHDETPATPVAE